jgi:hypothetical protein
MTETVELFNGIALKKTKPPKKWNEIAPEMTEEQIAARETQIAKDFVEQKTEIIDTKRAAAQAALRGFDAAHPEILPVATWPTYLVEPRLHALHAERTKLMQQLGRFPDPHIATLQEACDAALQFWSSDADVNIRHTQAAGEGRAAVLAIAREIPGLRAQVDAGCEAEYLLAKLRDAMKTHIAAATTEAKRLPPLSTRAGALPDFENWQPRKPRVTWHRPKGTKSWSSIPPGTSVQRDPQSEYVTLRDGEVPTAATPPDKFDIADPKEYAMPPLTEEQLR